MNLHFDPMYHQYYEQYTEGWIRVPIESFFGDPHEYRHSDLVNALHSFKSDKGFAVINRRDRITTVLFENEYDATMFLLKWKQT